jgi:protein Mpv17
VSGAGSSSNPSDDSDEPLQSVASTEADGIAAAAAVPLDAVPTTPTTTPGATTTKPPAAAALSRALGSLTRARWYSWYLERLEKQPTLTKAVTALCGFVIGDLVAQSLSSGGGGGVGALVGAGSHRVDWARTARMGAFGLLVDGPVGGAYYAWLDRTIFPDDPLSARTVITKTVLDQTVYSALGTVAFFTFIRLLETGGDVSAVGPTLAAKFWPTLVANYTIWPLAHLINFRFVSPPLRVAYNQVVAIGWLTWLSLLAHSRAAAAPAVAALTHKAVAASGGGGGGAGGWLQSLLSVLPHF